MTFPAKQISVSINRPVSDVYQFAANPENLPKWAAGLAQSSLRRFGDSWIAESPMGQVTIKFAPENQLGVMDHEVMLPSGEVNHNPFRVVRNGNGSEVIFTLYHLPRLSEANFKKDAEMVEKDLRKLKLLLEQ